MTEPRRFHWNIIILNALVHPGPPRSTQVRLGPPMSETLGDRYLLGVQCSWTLHRSDPTCLSICDNTYMNKHRHTHTHIKECAHKHICKCSLTHSSIQPNTAGPPYDFNFPCDTFNIITSCFPENGFLTFNLIINWMIFQLTVGLWEEADDRR